MQTSQVIAGAIAEAMTAMLVDAKLSASKAIDQLDQVQEELHLKAGELASHVASRPEVERSALEALLAQDNPATGKAFTKTDATANLDLFPAFAAWRAKRNQLEGDVHYLQGKVSVMQRRADLEIALLNVLAREA